VLEECFKCKTYRSRSVYSMMGRECSIWKVTGGSPHVHCLFGGHPSLTSGSELLEGRGLWVSDAMGHPSCRGNLKHMSLLESVGSFPYLYAF